MSPDEKRDLAKALADLATGRSLLGAETDLQIARLRRAGIPVDISRIEAMLGPIGEASRDELRGVIAALNAVNEATGGRQ